MLLSMSFQSPSFLFSVEPYLVLSCLLILMVFCPLSRFPPFLNKSTRWIHHSHWRDFHEAVFALRQINVRILYLKRRLISPLVGLHSVCVVNGEGSKLFGQVIFSSVLKWFMVYARGWQTLSVKVRVNRLCRVNSLCGNYSALPPFYKSRPWYDGNEWAQLCSSKSLLNKIGELDLALGLQLWTQFLFSDFLPNNYD